LAIGLRRQKPAWFREQKKEISKWLKSPLARSHIVVSLFHGRATSGPYTTADFSKLEKEGRYYLRADTLRSFPFSISNAVYQPGINMIVGYFSQQRCGASTTGYLSPCHLDDGIRFDNGKHQDVTGGWHDASDLRKWVSATIYGVMGLARAYDLQVPQYRKAILDELLWGNRYFLKCRNPRDM
jgi:hypothetical protein